MLETLNPASTVPPTELADAAGLSDAARELVAAAPSLYGLVSALSQARLPVDAVRLLVRALPKRYAVAWVCECFRRDAERQPLAEADAECLRCAETWIAEDNDANRRAGAERAAAMNYETPGSWLAAAVAWSGGSLAPRGFTVVPPPEHATGKACLAAVSLLAMRAGPEAFADTLGAWVERALDVFARKEPAARASASRP
ncbi:MAG TPA: hypothetical protein VMC02_00730 [Steroidobacteraceae bacterium]|nr:hypothetical protein [Steroidobacteraceae bacterium]